MSIVTPREWILHWVDVRWHIEKWFYCETILTLLVSDSHRRRYLVVKVKEVSYLEL